MNQQNSILQATLIAAIVIASSAASHAQTLIDFNIAPTGGNGQAVLGGATDVYNTYGTVGNNTPAAAAGTTLVTNAISSTGGSTGVSIWTGSGFDSYQTSSDSTTSPGFLMDGYAYSASNGNTQGVFTVPITLTFSGLTAYDGDTFTLEIYGAGNNAGNGDAITVGNTTLDTTGASRKISAGVGVAYQTFKGTVTGDTLSLTAAPNDTAQGENYQGPYDEVNGVQLQLTAATPEPSTWAMMIGGLGLLLGVTRFRNRLQA